MVDSISQAIETLGIFLVVVVLVIGFMPTLIAFLRNRKLKVFIIIVNVALIMVLPINFILSIIGWLMLMIMAVIGNKKI